MSDYELPPEWTFTSTITQPDGVRVDCTITVPEEHAYSDIVEVSEMAQMGAASGLGVWRRTQAAIARREEQPF